MRRRNILVVDDERYICELLEITFRKEGYRVEVAHNVESAKRKLESQIFDIIISDVRMPGEGGVDLLLVETSQDTRNIKAALLAIQNLSKEIGAQVPVIISVTIEAMGSMLAGQTIEAMWASLRHAKPLAFGMNCATGPEFMTDHIRTLSQLTGEFVSCYPNAGLPNPMSETGFDETPDVTAGLLEEFARAGLLNIAGGCCGTTPAHIAALASMAAGRKQRVKLSLGQSAPHRAPRSRSRTDPSQAPHGGRTSSR